MGVREEKTRIADAANFTSAEKLYGFSHRDMSETKMYKKKEKKKDGFYESVFEEQSCSFFPRDYYIGFTLRENRKKNKKNTGIVVHFRFFFFFIVFFKLKMKKSNSDFSTFFFFIFIHFIFAAWDDDL